jgi:hypothetical protein
MSGFFGLIHLENITKSNSLESLYEKNVWLSSLFVVHANINIFGCGGSG